MADEINNNPTGASAGTKNEDKISNANDFVLSDQTVTKNDSDGVGVLFGVEPGTVEQSGDPSGAASSSESELAASEVSGSSTSTNSSNLSSDNVDQSTGTTGGSNSQAGTSGPATTNSDITTGENGSIVDQNNLDDVDVVEATAVSGGGETTSGSAPASAAALAAVCISLRTNV